MRCRSPVHRHLTSSTLLDFWSSFLPLLVSMQTGPAFVCISPPPPSLFGLLRLELACRIPARADLPRHKLRPPLWSVTPGHLSGRRMASQAAGAFPPPKLVWSRPLCGRRDRVHALQVHQSSPRHARQPPLPGGSTAHAWLIRVLAARSGLLPARTHTRAITTTSPRAGCPWGSREHHQQCATA